MCRNSALRVEALTNRSHLLTIPPTDKETLLIPANSRITDVCPLNNHQAGASPVHRNGLEDNHKTQINPFNVREALAVPLAGVAAAVPTVPD